MQKSTLFNMPAFVIFGFPKIVKFGSEFIIKKYAPRSTNFEYIILKSKKLPLIILVLGILVCRFISSHFIGKDLKAVKSEMRQNQQKGFGKNYIIV
jgi:hypothetical protein